MYFYVSAKKLFWSSTVFSLAEAGNCVRISWLVKHINYM